MSFTNACFKCGKPFTTTLESIQHYCGSDPRYVPKSDYDRLQQELDAARARERFHIQTQSDLIDRASKFAQQLADVNAQIAEYEAALEKIKNGGVPYGVSADVTDRMLAMCEIARETLKKWKAK